jgi:hypothetical protein
MTKNITTLNAEGLTPNACSRILSRTFLLHFGAVSEIKAGK